MSDTPAAVGWYVTSQSETVGQNAAGQIVPGVEIGFNLSNGLSSSVFVPAADYARGASAVTAAIVAKATLLTEVAGLTGTVGG